MLKMLKERWLAGLVVLFAGFTIVYGVSIIIRHAEEGLVYGIGPIVAAALLVIGFFISERVPLKGAVMLVIGAVAIPIIHFWMFPIYIPISLVIISFGVYRARGFAKERDRIATA